MRSWPTWRAGRGCGPRSSPRWCAASRSGGRRLEPPQPVAARPGARRLRRAAEDRRRRGPCPRACGQRGAAHRGVVLFDGRGRRQEFPRRVGRTGQRQDHRGHDRGRGDLSPLGHGVAGAPRRASAGGSVPRDHGLRGRLARLRIPEARTARADSLPLAAQRPALDVGRAGRRATRSSICAAPTASPTSCSRPTPRHTSSRA